MNWLCGSHRALALGVAFFTFSSCTAEPVGAVPVPLKGSSRTMIVQGEYSPIALDRVDGLSFDKGKVIVHGPSSDVTVDVPATTEAAEPVRHWALVTEGEAGGRRALTFTHDMTLDDFTIELPRSDAQLYYGVLSGKAGDEMMVLAWGSGSRSYSCYLTITRAVIGGSGL